MVLQEGDKVCGGRKSAAVHQHVDRTVKGERLRLSQSLVAQHVEGGVSVEIPHRLRAEIGQKEGRRLRGFSPIPPQIDDVCF